MNSSGRSQLRVTYPQVGPTMSYECGMRVRPCFQFTSPSYAVLSASLSRPFHSEGVE